ncbi:MAG TPA: beta-galactosidase [Candidatus Ventrimonas merdavium]|nr:beta-galactosidase [Candidatus Ventrimonas merdavium]
MSVFEVKEEFLLDQKPVKILSGAIHYFRIVPEYWEDCFYNLKAMGFNTVETYIPWNLHEPEEGVFDFSRGKDIVRFVRLAQEMGLMVILRPTPFICAEWEFGGLPAWLLRYKDMKVRTNTPLFLEKVDAYYRELFSRIKDLQVTQGGPVIMLQVENEYGSFGNDKDYLRAIRDIMVRYGAEVPLFTSDGSWDAALEAGNLVEDGVLATANFGSRSNENLDALERFYERKGLKWPLMSMEFWDGWFNRWREPVITRDAKDLAACVKELLPRASINLYMFIGGTNFGFYNGCSARGNTDLPQITSYNYDAVLTEWGQPTAKFYEIREVIRELFPDIPTGEPRDHERKAFPAARLTDKVSLSATVDRLAQRQDSAYPKTMEEAGPGYGYMLYRTHVTGFDDVMKVKAIQTSDRVHFYLNGVFQGVQYQEEIGTEIEMEFGRDNVLELLVENMGRVNYGYKLQAPTQSKGIRTGVMVDIHFESGWEQYALPLDHVEQVDFSGEWKADTPAFYRYEFEADEPADTFLDCSRLGKGAAFVNGVNLGRYWSEGPVCYLYIPAPLLKAGKNEIILFETEGVTAESLELKAAPVYREG